MRKKNLFIAFEGIDGSGKTTQAGLLADALRRDGTLVHLTEEPTRERAGALIREVFSGRSEADHRTIAGLFVADRLDHLLQKNGGILKWLDEGFTVITDRFYFSSYAYQGAHMPIDWVIAAHSLAASIRRPDLNLFIDVSPEIAMERIRAGREATELYETLDNLRRVRGKYFEAFEKLRGQETVCIIDGNRPPDAIAGDIRRAVDPLL